LQNLHSCVTTHIAALESLGQPTEYWDAWLVTVILRKVDQSTNHEWQLRRKDTNLPTYSELEEFIASRCIAFESSETLDSNVGGETQKYSTNISNSKKPNHGVTRK